MKIEFIHIIAGMFSICAIIAFFCSLKKSIQVHSIRLCAIALIGALALFANNGFVYSVSVFIIATTITETEFLEKIAAILRDNKHYFDYLNKIKSRNEGVIPNGKSSPSVPKEASQR